MKDLTLEEYLSEISEENVMIKDEFYYCVYPENKHLECESCGYCEKYILDNPNISYD